MRPKFCHQVSSCWICSSRMLQRSVTRAISGLGRAAFPSIPWSLYQIRVRAKSDINVLFSTYKKKNSFWHERVLSLKVWVSFAWSSEMTFSNWFHSTGISVASCKTVLDSGFQVLNRPFYRYGGHIELSRFKEYYRMPRGYEHISFVFSSTSRDIFSKSFLGIRL